MKAYQILLCLITVLFLSLGQVLFKYSSTKIDTEKGALLASLLFNPVFCFALVIYSLATITWLLVLRITPLSLAYPFASFAFILVPVFAHVFLGESLSINKFLGSLIIIVGVYISTI